MTEDTMEQSEDQDSANDTNSNNPSNDTIISTSGKVTIPGDITSIGQDITESLNSVLQLLIKKGTLRYQRRIPRKNSTRRFMNPYHLTMRIAPRRSSKDLRGNGTNCTRTILGSLDLSPRVL